MIKVRVIIGVAKDGSLQAPIKSKTFDIPEGKFEVLVEKIFKDITYHNAEFIINEAKKEQTKLPL